MNPVPAAARGFGMFGSAREIRITVPTASIDPFYQFVATLYFMSDEVMISITFPFLHDLK